VKICRVCKQLKTDSAFGLKNGKSDSQCRECHNTYYRNLYNSNPVRKAHMQALIAKGKQRRRGQQYGLTPEEFDTLKISNNGLCHLCNLRKATDVDHDHVTGKVRGHLCNSCNTALGKLGDSTEGLTKAINYINGK
jgi:hypothetical protein